MHILYFSFTILGLLYTFINGISVVYLWWRQQKKKPQVLSDVTTLNFLLVYFEYKEKQKAA